MIHVSKFLPADRINNIIQKADRAAILTDSNVAGLLDDLGLPSVERIIIPAGEKNKTIATCEDVWRQMSDTSLTRHSVLLNVGGGVVTDLGGFCAATYLRGIPFVNISTSLLGAVDASIGGKTGVDLGPLKNRVGVFANPLGTFIPLNAFLTLPETEILSGYAEMIKTGYIASETLTDQLLHFTPYPVDVDAIESLVKACLEVKDAVVTRDPYEKGERKTLNFGHTAGHAFEEFAMTSGSGNLPHGIAVAHGLLVALILSHTQLGLPSKEIYRFADKLNAEFPPMRLRCDDYDDLLSLMRLDKKNRADGKIRFALLSAIGKCEPDIPVADEEIKNALDIYSDLTHQ